MAKTSGMVEPNFLRLFQDYSVFREHKPVLLDSSDLVTKLLSHLPQDDLANHHAISISFLYWLALDLPRHRMLLELVLDGGVQKELVNARQAVAVALTQCPIDELSAMDRFLVGDNGKQVIRTLLKNDIGLLQTLKALLPVPERQQELQQLSPARGTSNYSNAVLFKPTWAPAPAVSQPGHSSFSAG